jgi:hypothetical protein
LLRSTAVIEFDLGGHVLTANDQFLRGRGYNLAQSASEGIEALGKQSLLISSIVETLSSQVIRPA